MRVLHLDLGWRRGCWHPEQRRCDPHPCPPAPGWGHWGGGHWGAMGAGRGLRSILDPNRVQWDAAKGSWGGGKLRQGWTWDPPAPPHPPIPLCPSTQGGFGGPSLSLPPHPRWCLAIFNHSAMLPTELSPTTLYPPLGGGVGRGGGQHPGGQQDPIYPGRGEVGTPSIYSCCLAELLTPRC